MDNEVVVSVANLGVYFQMSADYQIETKMLEKKKHIVVPVVMMVEGVHNGSHGPLLHLMEELGKFPESWNGRPVVINHPEEDGHNISANSPHVIESTTVGKIFNTYVKGNKLMAEAWLDEEKLKEVSDKIYTQINAKEPIEISIGVFTDDEYEEGDWNGETYAAIARNHRPDHLAILPDCVGACSCADGCGIRANKANTKDIIVKPCGEMVAGLSKQEGNDDDVINNNVKPKEVIKMEQTKCTPCVEKKVIELITNSGGRFIEDDKVWLETLEEVQLDKMFVKKEEPKPDEEELLEQKKKKEGCANSVNTNQLSPEDEAALAYGKKLLRERRESMIQGIQANTEKGVWEESVLGTMTEDMLERVFKSVKKEEPTGNYSVNAAAPINTNVSTSGGSLYPTGVVIENKK